MNPTHIQAPVKVIAVTGGKGGVGKTCVAANLGLTLASMGRAVMLMDADLGLANLDVVLGLRCRNTLADVLEGRCELADIVVTGPHGLRVVPGASGIGRMATLGDGELAGLINAFNDLTGRLDYLIVDTAAGISASVTRFSRAAQRVLVVLSSEPASLTDAYALIKVLSREHGVQRFEVLTNQVRRTGEGRECFIGLARVCEQFLDVTLDFLGSVPADPFLRQSVSSRRAVVDLYPQSPSSRAFRNLASQVETWEPASVARGHIEFFLQRLVAPGPLAGAATT
ncbi:MAG TPA: MinD/ParA family protein [Steroidobacteraceae bacterium]|nr:MinD/ParA family protein [Steroidobacteraceae bacterium]